MCVGRAQAEDLYNYELEVSSQPSTPRSSAAAASPRDQKARPVGIVAAVRHCLCPTEEMGCR